MKEAIKFYLVFIFVLATLQGCDGTKDTEKPLPPYSGERTVVGDGHGSAYFLFTFTDLSAADGRGITKKLSPIKVKKLSSDDRVCPPPLEETMACIDIWSLDTDDVFVHTCGQIFPVPATLFDASADESEMVWLFDLQVQGLLPGSRYSAVGKFFYDDGSPVGCCTEAVPVDDIVIPEGESEDNSIHVDLVSICGGTARGTANFALHQCFLPWILYGMEGEDKYIGCDSIEIPISLEDGNCDYLPLDISVWEEPSCSDSSVSFDDETSIIDYAPGCNIPAANTPVELISQACVLINETPYCTSEYHQDIWTWDCE